MAATETMTLDQFGAWCTTQGLALQDVARKLRPAFRALVPMTIAGMKEGFQTSTAPDGSTWAPPRHRAGRPLLDHGVMEGAAQAVETPDGVKAFNQSKQARLHQQGGTIKPRSAKALAIPLSTEARRIDGARFFPRDLFVLKANGKAFLAETGGLKGRGKKKSMDLIFHYILLRQTTIPARPHVGFSVKTLNRISQFLQDQTLRLITQGGL